MKKCLLAVALAAAVCLTLLCTPVRAAETSVGSLSALFRAYYLHRPFEFSGVQQSLAAGGWLSYLSPQWHGLSFGVTGYTSQPVGHQDPDQGGGGLLTDTRKGYSVLGQAWLQGTWRGFSLKAGRQIIETPLINSYDVKMTPVTLEALAMNYGLGQGLEISAAHLTGIKTWNETVFQPMSRAAGLGGDEPVTLVGLVWQPAKDRSVQFWEYFCHEFMNMVYAQTDYSFALTPDSSLTVSIQGLHQRDIGNSLGGDFNTGQLGGRGVFSWKGWDLTLGYTATSQNHDIVNPWGSYPGFTSIMEEDRDRAGERSAVLGLAYDFTRVGLDGLSAYTMHTVGTTPDSGSKASPDQTEHDLTIDYRFQQGPLKGLWIRLRGATVNADEKLGGEDFTDFRVIVNYPFKILK